MLFSPFFLLILPVSVLAQAQLWVLDGFGEVHSIPAAPSPEIVITLPGGVTMELVLIPAGGFQMGSTDGPDWSSCHEDYGYSNCEQPVHQVNIGYNFGMGKFEVTQAQWESLMGTNPARNFGVGDNYPVHSVSWNDCQQFITVLNNHITSTGEGPATFRLPSEAEWEYACRAGTTTRFYFGDSDGCGTDCTDCAAGTLAGNRSDYMWYCGNNSPYGSKPVGGKLPNAFGLYDMSGNAWEWCEDYWHAGYTGAPSDGSAWESPTSLFRVFRGGSWLSLAQRCRSAHRLGRNPGYGYYTIGFRLVRTP